MAWQHHLKRIADFLYERCLMIESENALIFFDSIKNIKPLYKPHHFRSFTVKKEIAHVAAYWEKCLSNKNLIPARVIITEEGSNMSNHKCHRRGKSTNLWRARRYY